MAQLIIVQLNNANAKEAIKRARALKQKALDAFNQSIMG